MSRDRLVVTILMLVTTVAAQEPPRTKKDAHVQRGASIVWHRDLDKAVERSKKDGRPVIAYFTFET